MGFFEVKMFDLFKLRVRKLLYSIFHLACWRALFFGVVPSIEHISVVASLKLDSVIDVGANRGQFSLLCRILHPRIQIHAFEPLKSESTLYRKVFERDAMVNLYEFALGEICGVAKIHLSRSADSSSLLPIGKMQSTLFPATEEIGVQTITIGALDEIEEIWKSSNRILLKIDVQGYELSVLKGATRALKRCVYVYVECSEVPLYTGQALYMEVAIFLGQHGFRPIQRTNEQFVDGKLIQADHLFARI